MRNLLLTLDYPPKRGGVARYLDALVSTYPTRFEVISDVSQLLSDTIWPRWARTLRTLRDRRGDFDQLWVSHLHPLGLVALVSKFLWRKPYVLLLHGFDFRLGLRNPWKRFLTRRILKGARLIVCNSKALSLQVRAFAHEIKKPLVVYPTLPDHLDIAVSKQMPTIASDGLFRVLTVARLVPRKNHRAVLEALVELPDLHYTIVGDGPEREGLEQEVERLGLRDRVHLLTGVTDDDLATCYAEADVFILPVLPDEVDVEGFGIVYLEAAAAGLPIVATKLPGVEEALDSEGSVQVLEPLPGVLAEVLEQLREDSQRRKAMGEKNRAFVKRFSREEQFTKLESYV